MSELAERLKRAWDENDDLWVALHDPDIAADIAADVAESFFREELERQRAEFVASLEPLRDAMNAWDACATWVHVAAIDEARALLGRYADGSPSDVSAANQLPEDAS